MKKMSTPGSRNCMWKGSVIKEMDVNHRGKQGRPVAGE
jgi:hypothetical protein